MGFIQGEIHFVNYLNKIIKNSDLPPDDFYEIKYYVHHIFKKGQADKFTWLIKKNPEIATKENIKNFINDQYGREYFLKSHYHSYSVDFLNKIYEYNFPGVYMFKTDNDILYIGSSKLLNERITTSAYHNTNVRRNTKQKVYLSIIKTNTEIDARVLEMYWIGKLKPINNTFGLTEETMSIEILNSPTFSEPIEISVNITPYDIMGDKLYVPSSKKC